MRKIEIEHREERERADPILGKNDIPLIGGGPRSSAPPCPRGHRIYGGPAASPTGEEDLFL